MRQRLLEQNRQIGGGQLLEACGGGESGDGEAAFDRAALLATLREAAAAAKKTRTRGLKPHSGTGGSFSSTSKGKKPVAPLPASCNIYKTRN